MGKVNVVLPDGRVVAVDESDAAKMQAAAGEDQAHHAAPQETAAAEQAAVDERIRHEVYGGVGGAIESAAGGALDTLTLGAGTRLLDSGDTYKKSVAEHPLANIAGDVGALVVPGLGEVGTGFDLVRGGAEAAGLGRVGARAVEGAAFGVGGSIAKSNITGDPLTLEGTLEDAGIGAVLNVGVGAMADSFRGLAKRGQAAVDETAQLKADIGLAQQGRKIFEEAPPSWTDFVENHKAATSAANEYNREVEKETEAYTQYYKTSKLGTAADRTQDVINELQNERYAAQNANVQYVDGKPRAVQYVYDEGGSNERRVLSPSKPAVTPEYVARMKEYQRRMSRVYKLQSGEYEIDKTGNWVKNPAIPADPQRALEELRAIQTDLKAEFPKAANGLGRYGDLPEMPREPVPVADVRLPKTPREFSRMTAEKVNELANGLDPASVESFQKFAADAGLQVYPDVAQTVAGVHKSLSDYVKAADRVASAAAKAAEKKANSPWFLRLARTAARGAAGRWMDIGGPIGAITRSVGSDLAGKAMTGVEDSVLGGGFLASKESIKDKVQRLVAKWGVPAANTVDRMRPVTSYLATAFPSGERDKETDLRKLAANRVNDIANLSAMVHDASFVALQPLLGAPNDVAFKMHDKIVGAVMHLAQTMPRDNGLNTTMFGSNWTPAYHEALELAHRLEAVQDPLAAVARVLAGSGHPAAVQTLWAVYPAIMQEFASEVGTQAPRLQKLDHQQSRAYSTLMQQPMSGLQHPVVITTLQGLFLPKSPTPSGGGGGGAPGRPPAVQSQVAGSNVSSLISQA